MTDKDECKCKETAHVPYCVTHLRPVGICKTIKLAKEKIDVIMKNKIMLHTHTVGDPPCTRCDINVVIKRTMKELDRIFKEMNVK